ncbi:protein phosphatase CheZ [Desulfosoma caldarium]|uniref:Protein phosphatase CheZ n=1 Tax=Desulfosoma caldarium TaxID=610254 RepID=A0A3N1VIQ0_9BACT|nr:protein phosphatase CheZ [Desulfosoma caldarium]ROR01909.1 chemotaxis regulatin CheY-phosphate phosphatase CheZ [Desulfosoma caldarium]
MDMMIGKEEWRDLLQLMEDAVSIITETTEPTPPWNRCAEALKTLSSTAAMLGMEGLAKAGEVLETHLEARLCGNGEATEEAAAVFQFALNALREQVRHAYRAEAVDIDPAEVVSILENAKASETATDATCEDVEEGGEAELDEAAIIDKLVGVPSCETAQDSQQMDPGLGAIEDFCQRLQGSITLESSGGSVPVAHIQLTLTPEVLHRIQRMLNPTDSLEDLRLKVPEHNEAVGTLLESIKDFMQALTEGDIEMAEQILITLSENRHPGLYKEIGGIARALHNSLRDFVRTMDPSLREMVEEKIPDSGNRLEHIIKLTESAANTTLDHVESLQKRNEQDQGRLKTIQEMLTGLQPLGENAQKKLNEAVNLVRELLQSTQKSHEDLIRILTAQDYQDLTGQIIMKIIALLEDLEAKLVQLITKFGVKVDKTQKGKEELYGPAHEKLEDALHSQSDVDALLAEFGF